MQSNEVRIPKNPDFDLSPSAPPCQYFKSSFARSLSLTTSGTKSLDIDINFGLTPFDIGTIDDESPRSLGMSCGSMGAIKAARSLLFNAAEEINENGNGLTADHQLNLQTQQQQPHAPEESQMTPPTPIQNQHQQELFPIQNSPNNNNNDFEVLRLRKECQSLIEENRRLIGLASNCEVDNRHVIVNGNGMTTTTTNNCNGKNGSVVEAVFLQTQIDTLNWQLKQVESSRQMYRAVTEEVARFLDRCYRSLEAIHQQQSQTGTTIGRSKSVVQVSKHHDSDSSCSTSMIKTKSTSRARSSTNLIDAKYFCGNKSIDVSCDSYENFRDFTWRRTPKTKQAPSNLEVNPEKLSNEAYRLLRTVQNLMNTQEPLLLNPTNNAMPPTLEAPLIKSSDEPFSRKSQSRESRLSIRSSTDDSVHSNATTTTTNSSSSLKTETDEEHPSPLLNIPSQQQQLQHNTNTHLDRIKDGILSSIDDESGFSSMNSFQEIGLPLVNSTMRSISSGSASSSSASSASSTTESTTEMENTAIENNLKNSTLIATTLNQEKLGLPRVAHRRWDSAPVTNNRLQLSNAEDSLRVLWV